MIRQEFPSQDSYPLHKIKINDYDLTYWEEGTQYKNKKPTLYFLHGWMGEITEYYWQFEYFSSKFHVMAHNHRSHGTSTSRDEPVTMKALAEDFYQILEQKAIKDFILIGHSMGTFVSLEFALKHQDSLKALVLIGGASRLPVQPAVIGLLQSINSMKELATLMSGSFDIPLRKRPKDQREFYAKLAQWEINNKTKLPLYVARRFYDGFKDYDVTAHLDEIKVPTLIIFGEADILVGQKENSEILSAIPNSEIVLIKDSGHSPTREQFEHTNKVLEEFFNRFL